MKCLTLIIHMEAKQDLVDMLLSRPDLTGFTVIDGEGHSRDTCKNPFETTQDHVRGFVPRVRVDIVASDEVVAEILEQLRDCESCVAGLGVYWITEVEKRGNL